MYSFHLEEEQIRLLTQLYGEEDDVFRILDHLEGEGQFTVSKGELTDFLGFLEDAFNYEDEYADTDGVIEEIYESVSEQVSLL